MSQTKEWNSQIFQVVCVVRNVEEILENWKRMVAFDVSSIETGTSDDSACCIYQGSQIKCAAKWACFDLGGIQMKLVEPLNKEGGDPYSDKLKKSGQGFHHIGFYAEDYPALMAMYEAKGLSPVYEEMAAGRSYKLYDFEEQIGMSAVPWDSMTGPCARISKGSSRV